MDRKQKITLLKNYKELLNYLKEEIKPVYEKPKVKVLKRSYKKN